ncbi:chaperone ClpB [Clostridia bacterium]|nr:chaperone ClpB [Clostridia bacterium]
MKPKLCSRCNKYMAVVFITRVENGKTTNEGLCLKCARELGIKPVDDILKRMNIPDDEMDNLSNEMMEAFEGFEEMFGMTDDDDDDEEEEEEGRTATFPFMHRLFSNSDGTPEETTEKNSEEEEDPFASIFRIFNGDKKGKKDDEAALPPGQPRQQRERKERGDKGRPKRKFLDTYCLSLSKRAQDGKLDTVIGRDTEIERVLQILNRRKKNNPCLIGEPGVGKTAIAEGLAIYIHEGKVPPKLQSKEVFLLDMTALVAGTQFRGQFESRMKGLVEEIRREGNIVLVIDEVHTLIGAGDAEGSMNAANILKPALSRGEIQVIGATTFTEYRKHIEKDAALERRFQPVKVGEPNIEQSVSILRGVSRYYELYHGVEIPDDVIRAAVVMSERYVTDRFLPDKAIDLIDEACSALNLKNPEIAEGEAIRIKLEQIRAESAALSDQSTTSAYERMAYLRSEEINLENRHAELLKLGSPRLDTEHLAAVIEQLTGVPALSIQEQEFERLSKLEQRLKERVVGQDEAVSSVSAAIRRGRVGLSVKPRPVSFIFAGPTGVGKTELVKCLAEDMFSAPEALIRLDMSEFMEKHSVSRIIGSPPGYVGYDEAGQLTEKVRRNPYSVVLFDEIEKAHPDVLNIMLQILDDGHITDAQGRKVNFEHTIVIMTSNAGSGNSAGTAGFGGGDTLQSRDKAIKALKEIMRPEFLNRVDEVIAFNPLQKESFGRIAEIMLGDLTIAMQKNGITFTYDPSLVAFLAEKSFSVTYGARNLRRVIQKEVEDKIAGLVINGYVDQVKRISAKVEENLVVVQ